jgi:hypothetical protein
LIDDEPHTEEILHMLHRDRRNHESLPRHRWHIPNTQFVTW